jgi:hypothetical protein
MKRPYEINHRLPLVLGVLLCGVIGWITGLLIQTQQDSATMSREVNLQTDLYSMRDKVDRTLRSMLHLSIGMTAYVDAKRWRAGRTRNRN